MPENQYSPDLCRYVGQVEIESSRIKDPFERYTCFCNALESLGRAGLSEQDSRIARKLLHNRARETRPGNIGCASGEAGEAD